MKGAVQAGVAGVAAGGLLLAPGAVRGGSLRFHGNGTGDIDRVKVRIDAPARPADVGATDFTVELWLKALPGENASGPCTEGADAWIGGNIVVDRDVYGAGDFGDYGVSLYGGRIAFGAATAAGSDTICSTASVDDGAWHHVTLTRRLSDGQMRIFIDGQLQPSVGSGPAGNASYRDGRATAWPASDPFLVFGAEKHDAGPAYPSFHGWLDEVRLSTVLRYTASFARPPSGWAGRPPGPSGRPTRPSSRTSRRRSTRSRLAASRTHGARRDRSAHLLSPPEPRARSSWWAARAWCRRPPGRCRST